MSFVRCLWKVSHADHLHSERLGLDEGQQVRVEAFAGAPLKEGMRRPCDSHIDLVDATASQNGGKQSEGVGITIGTSWRALGFGRFVIFVSHFDARDPN